MSGQEIWVKSAGATFYLRSLPSNLCNSGFPAAFAHTGKMLPILCSEGTSKLWMVATVAPTDVLGISATSESGARLTLTTVPALPGLTVTVAVGFSRTPLGPNVSIDLP